MKNYIKILIISISLIIVIPIYSQVIISDKGGTSSDASAVLELESTTKGFLIPRMTTIERIAISSPTIGLMVFDITLNKFYVYNGSAWESTNSHWLGSTTRIKLLPKDFIGTLGGSSGSRSTLSIYDDDSDDDTYGMVATEAASFLVATVAIPTGYQVTSVTVYGATANAYHAFVGDITSADNLTTPIASSTIGSTITFSTAIESTNTNYLIISVSFPNALQDQIYGGNVEIEPF